MSEFPSDLTSETNDSVSATYEGVHGHIADFSAASTVQNVSSNSTDTLVQALERQILNLDKKSREITKLKVIESQLQSELEKKDEIIQQQAIKINDLMIQESITIRNFMQTIKEKDNTIAKQSDEIAALRASESQFIQQILRTNKNSSTIYQKNGESSRDDVLPS